MSSDIRLSLGYRDPVAAIPFLSSLGFEEGVVHDGEIYHAEVSWPAGGVIHLHSAKPDGKSVSDLADRAASDGGYPAFSVHIDVPDPDPLHERAVQAGARVVRELQVPGIPRPHQAVRVRTRSLRAGDPRRPLRRPRRGPGRSPHLLPPGGRLRRPIAARWKPELRTGTGRNPFYGGRLPTPHIGPHTDT